MVEQVGSEAALAERLAQFRDETFEEPSSVPDDEIRKVARWAWQKRCDNSIYTGGSSAFRIERDVVELLSSSPDALALYVTLNSQHGHQPGKAFGLNHDAMRNAGLINLSRERFREARRALENAGLLELALCHQQGVKARQYRLSRPARGLSERLLRLRVGKKKEAGL